MPSYNELTSEQSRKFSDGTFQSAIAVEGDDVAQTRGNITA